MLELNQALGKPKPAISVKIFLVYKPNRPNAIFAMDKSLNTEDRKGKSFIVNQIKSLSTN